MNTSLHYLLQPTTWTSPPESYSFSSLATIKSCPRRWLLINSRWGEFAKFPQRARPSAIEGQIVHDALDRLAKELGRVGRPPIGSSAFSEAVEQSGFWGYFAEQITDWNSKLTQHPRSGSMYVVRTKPADLANLAVRLFRQQYRTGNEKTISETRPAYRVGFGGGSVSLSTILKERGNLSELTLKHPSLPVVGVLDLVQQGDNDNIAIVDFKTGKPKPEHKDQLETYAVLWWRATGQFPTHLAIQYLDTAHEWRVSPDQVRSREDALAAEVRLATAVLSSPPAPAQPGEACVWCPVRARCDDGWKSRERAPADSLESNRSIDLELIVASLPGTTGYAATLLDGKRVHIVYDAATGANLPPVEVGERLRLIDAMANPGDNEIEIRPWTETYRH